MRRVALRLKEPLQLSSGAPLEQRRGVLLQVTTMAGTVAVGECMPLPGFHQETSEEAEAQLLAVAEMLAGRIVPPNWPLLQEGVLAAWLVSSQRSSRPSTSRVAATLNVCPRCSIYVCGWVGVSWKALGEAGSDSSVPESAVVSFLS